MTDFYFVEKLGDVQDDFVLELMHKGFDKSLLAKLNRCLVNESEPAFSKVQEAIDTYQVIEDDAEFAETLDLIFKYN